MTSNGRAESIQRLKQLSEVSFKVAQQGRNSPTFLSWRAEARQALIAAVGETDPLVTQYDNLKFEMSKEVLAAFEKSLGKVRIVTADEDSNVSRIHKPAILESSHQLHFERAMAEAAEILLAATLSLRS
jgi:hypothetical protein